MWLSWKSQLPINSKHIFLLISFLLVQQVLGNLLLYFVIWFYYYVHLISVHAHACMCVEGEGVGNLYNTWPVSVDLDIVNQLLTTYFLFFRYWTQKMGLHQGTALLIYKLQQSLWFSQKESFVHILIQSQIPTEVVRIIRTCLNKTYSKLTYPRTYHSLSTQNTPPNTTVSPLVYMSGIT
jgi:hypothetical protein